MTEIACVLIQLYENLRRHQIYTFEAKVSEAVPNRYRPSIFIHPIVVT